MSKPISLLDAQLEKAREAVTAKHWPNGKRKCAIGVYYSADELCDQFDAEQEVIRRHLALKEQG